VILSVLVGDIGINVSLQTSALVGPLYIEMNNCLKIKGNEAICLDYRTP
jgi:hypothetical protein